MKILVTGANGYIGTRLLPLLAEGGLHEVYALVRSASRLKVPSHLKNKITLVSGDLLDLSSCGKLPEEIDAAFYLVHSMSHTGKPFYEQEKRCAENFISLMKQVSAKQIVYLSGLVSDRELSEHLKSRLNVETLIRASGIPYTILRAGIIIGSGSASFEIIRDLVEKLPVMVAPKWVKNRCQPIGIQDVLYYLTQVIGNEKCLNRVFDIGGPDRLSYLEMMKQFAEVRGLKRWIITVPVLTPRLSSYWLYFVTSTNFPLARSLVDSLKNEAVCTENSIEGIIPRKCLPYKEAIARAFSIIEQNAIVSSWKDAIVVSRLNPDLQEYIQVPTDACFREVVETPFDCPVAAVVEQVWRIGGDRGWYYMHWAWVVRGFVDKVFGGVGLDRGRTHPDSLQAGDSLDFWRVVLADKAKGHLLLYAEMKLPGEAWLELEVDESYLVQKATFRPKGVLGRLYWYCLYPVHHFIFKGMPASIIKRAERAWLEN